MPKKKHESGSLPTKSATKEQTVVLVQSLLVTWKVLEHLEDKGVIKRAAAKDRLALREDAGCCKPDGGTCCVNKK